jgi:hypothetical protein
LLRPCCTFTPARRCKISPALTDWFAEAGASCGSLGFDRAATHSRNHSCCFDDYRGRYIKQTDPTANFGDETYYGQDIIFQTERCNTFVIGPPYPWSGKRLGEGTPREREIAFRTAKSDLENYPDLARALDVVRLFESDLFRGSIVPILLAHRHASISLVPGGRVLDIASMIRFGRTRQPPGLMSST